MPHYLATNRGHINIAGNTIGLRKRHGLHVESEFGSTWRFKSFVDVKFILLERAPAIIEEMTATKLEYIIRPPIYSSHY